MKTEVTRADGWLNYWTSQQTARLDCNTDTHRYCYFWCIVYPIPMSNTCLSALPTCEQPSIYCIRCCLSTDVQVLANRGNLPRCLQAELHSGQIVSSLPEAPKPSRQRSLFAPIGNNGIKREAMQAQGEHANSPSLWGGHHVASCEQMYHFHYLLLSWFVEWDWCTEFWAGLVAESTQRSKGGASLGANQDGQDQARPHQRDSQRMSDVLEIKPARPGWGGVGMFREGTVKTS